jgi:uncharacterized membrane protein
MPEALSPFHPRTVHFPIAFALVGVAFVIMGCALNRERFSAFGQISLVVGWIGVLVAVATGLVDQAGAPDDPVVRDVINQHITAGIGLLAALGLAIYWPLRNKQLWDRPASRYGYLALLGVVVLLVLLEGWLGGKLVFDFGVGVR